MKISQDRWKLVLGATLALFAGGCGGLSDREADLFEKGRTAVASRDWASAGQYLDQVIEVEPKYIPAYFLRGQVHFELGKYEESIKDLTFAEASGRLEDAEKLTAVLYRGRSFLEMGRALSPDSEMRSDAGKPDDRRKARDFFLKGNLTLIEAQSLQPTSYDSNLWRGYALCRLENYRKALDILALCEKAEPARWEHRFFAALAAEGIYKINSQSLDAYFAILASGARPELAPVYEHLAAICAETAPEMARRILSIVEDYVKAVPAHSPRIDTFLAEARARRDAERKQARLKKVTNEVQGLADKGNFKEAIALIESFLKEEGESAEATRLQKDTQESWSLLLEAKTEGLVGSGEKDKLDIALKNLELARSLTNKVDRLVVIQQKLNAVQLSLSRQDTSRKIQLTYELLKSGKHQEVLDQLAATSTDGLSERDRDLYHYLRGSASYALGQWTAAVKSFSAIGQRNFDSLDVLHGLALVRSGQESAGVALLVNIPVEGRGDEVNRVLGQHFADTGEFRKAVSYLSSVKTPTPSDLEAHLKTRRELGMECYKRGDYSHAVEELQAARQILEAQLHRRVVDVYLLLGNAYFRMEDYDKAKKSYQDLSDTDLTAAEREQCRDLFLYRAQIYLREKSPDLAHADLAELVRLGGQIPPELANTYGRLVATYASFLPLEKVQYWNYTSTARDYNYTLFVKEETGGDYHVERREAGNTSVETWSRQGVVLTKKIGESIVKLPINLKPAEEALPYLEYSSQGQQCTSEIVATGQTVEVPGGKKFTDCLKVRVRRSQKVADGSIRSTRYIFYFAPNVGEVRQEIYNDDTKVPTKVSEIVLSDYALKTSELGN
jgi:tetratricopeptide (TPR) repeat protein